MLSLYILTLSLGAVALGVGQVMMVCVRMCVQQLSLNF